MKKLFLSLLLLLVSFINAQEGVNPRLKMTDINETTAYVDSMMQSLIKTHFVKGAVVTIVKDGSLFFSKGYGFTDINNKKPVTADKTLFRAASVSKVITASVIMQLVMQGKLDLNRDVNDYLKEFKIPEAFNKPITLHNLLTHTAGFDDKYIGKSAKTPEQQGSLKDFLKSYMPERIMPPGEIFVYSNYSNALAAYIVEAVTGIDFAEYARKYFFLPLDMTNTSFRGPGPEQQVNMSGVFSFDNGKMYEYPFDYLKDYPAGQMLSTGNDMAKFIMLHVNKTGYENVLSEKEINFMHAMQFTHDKKLAAASGISFGLDSINGEKIIMHDGGYLGVTSRLFIFPELKFGFYIATNTSSGGLVTEFTEALINKYLPYTVNRNEGYPLTQLPVFDTDIDSYLGSYRFARYSHNGFEKVGVLSGFFGDELPVWKNESGMLMMYDGNGKERRMIQIEPGLFMSIDDNYYIKFRKDENGKVTHLFTNEVAAFEKVPYLLTLPAQHNIFVFAMIVFVLSFFGKFIRKIFYKEAEPENEYNTRLYKYIKNIGTLFTLHLAGMGLVFYVLVPREELMFGFLYGLPKTLYAIQLLPIAGILLTLYVVYYIVKNYKKFTLQQYDKIGLYIFLITTFLYIWFLWIWNLLGFKF